VVAAWRNPAILLTVTLTSCGLVACGGGSPVSTTTNAYHGLALHPSQLAPPLVLRNYTGERIDLARLRGDAVLVSFVYTHCPDVCPLITTHLGIAQRRLGASARARLRILLVSVDPRRDTRPVVASYLAERGVAGSVDYLIGSVGELRPVWRAWQIAVDLSNPDTAVHSALVYGITAHGRVAVVYPSNFSPSWIDDDVARLEHS
jgi:protein SCO1